MSFHWLPTPVFPVWLGVVTSHLLRMFSVITSAAFLIHFLLYHAHPLAIGYTSFCLKTNPSLDHNSLLSNYPISIKTSCKSCLYSFSAVSSVHYNQDSSSIFLIKDDWNLALSNDHFSVLFLSDISVPHDMTITLLFKVLFVWLLRLCILLFPTVLAGEGGGGAPFFLETHSLGDLIQCLDVGYIPWFDHFNPILSLIPMYIYS